MLPDRALFHVWIRILKKQILQNFVAYTVPEVILLVLLGCNSPELVIACVVDLSFAFLLRRAAR